MPTFSTTARRGCSAEVDFFKVARGLATLAAKPL
jgi:hypothetical protein